MTAVLCPSSSEAQLTCRSPLPARAERFAAEFSIITGLRELASGDVVVADILERRLTFLSDTEQRVARQISRHGDGPGEYRAPRFLFALGGDSTLVADAQSRRWLMLSGTSVVETASASEPLSRILGPDLKGADESGRVLQVLYDVRRQVAGAADSGVVVLAHRSTARIDTIARVFRPAKPVTEVRFESTPVRYWMSNPLLVEEQVVLFHDGWIALVRANPYRVDWITPTMEVRRGRPLPAARVPVDDEEKRATAARVSAGYPVTFVPEHFAAWPEILPPFTRDAVLAAPDGSLLVRRMPSARDTSTVYDILDRNGNLVRTFHLARNRHVVGFGARAVYVVCRDELDVQTLERRPWP